MGEAKACKKKKLSPKKKKWGTEALCQLQLLNAFPKHRPNCQRVQEALSFPLMVSLL